MFGLFGKKNKKETKPIEINQEEATLAEIVEEEDEEELIAVIAAAVACVLKKPVSGFRVVSFKKRPRWNSL